MHLVRHAGLAILALLPMPGGCATAPDATAAVEVLDRQKSDFIARCEAFERLWPGYREALHLVVDGVEQPEPMNDRSVRMRDHGPIEFIYESRIEDRGAQVSTEVREVSVWEGAGPGEGAWVRRFTASGVRSGLDIVVRVPVVAPDGGALEILVNGAPLEVERGTLEARVPLARDESTLIRVRRMTGSSTD